MSTSSSSSITTTTVNGTTRITGLSSGIDVDGIVEQLMTAEKSKLNKLEQKEQLAEWQQTAYRDITSDIQDFCSTYFSTTSSSSLIKASNYLQYSVTSDSSAVTATYTSAASAGNHTIEVSQLATAATLTSSASISKDVQGTAAADYSDLSGQSFVIELDGTERTVTLEDVTDLDSLQAAIDDAVGEGKVTVSEDSSTGYLVMTAADDSGVQEITISAPSSGTSGLSNLGFGDDAILSNRLDTSDTLATIADQLSTADALTFNSDGQIELTINGTTLTFDQDDTLAEMIDEVNDADLGVTMEYDELSGKLQMTADDTGAGSTLVVTEGDGSNFLSTCLSVATEGLDSKVTIDGTALTRSSNVLTLDGVTYTLNQTTDDEATVSLTQDTDAIYDLISNFVDAYNTLISSINTTLNETYDSDYPPLTDDQKDDMTDEEIANWETKAKTGILADDSILTSFLREMRRSLINSVSGSSVTITSIGITTGTYDEEGQLNIDEDTLKAAIESDASAVMDLFSQKSTTYSSNSSVRTLSTSQLSTRYAEEGIAYRFYDTLAKYISTTRDSSGNKGLLLEKAGIEDDTSDTDNTLTTLIDKYEDEISDEEDRLDDYEDTLYDKYTTLETYISKMNTQLSALSSMTSS